MKMLTIVIPVYNEEVTIIQILTKIKSIELLSNITKEIIIINDFSQDRTKNLIQKYISENNDLEVKYNEHVVNKGKGASIHTRINNSTGDLIIIQDADLEYNPNEYNLLLKPIVNGLADVVYGSRFKGASPHRILFFWHSIGNKLITFISNLLTNLNLSDMETCYKMFRTEIIQNIKLRENRFSFEPEVTAKISRIPNI